MIYFVTSTDFTTPILSAVLNTVSFWFTLVDERVIKTYVAYSNFLSPQINHMYTC